MNEAMEYFTPRTSLIGQDRLPLFDALVNYAKSEVIPFDVPGHKMGARMNPLKQVLGEMTLRMDVNSMKELDLLSHPKSVIKEAQRLAADAFGADHAYFLVNGTTVGIQAMILAVSRSNDTIIVPRNGHKSVMDGIILSGAKPVFIQPDVDDQFGISHGVSVENVEKTIQAHPEAKALLMTYPTYFGTMADLTRICQIAHAHGITVIVDGAHGAHLNFIEMIDPISAGADAVTISMHKTGGSFTQSSLLLLKNHRIKPEAIQKTLSMLQSTSANYLLMGSLDVARRELALYGKERYRQLKPIVEQAIREIESETKFEILKDEYVANHFNQTHDWTKLVIRVNGAGLTGFEVYTLLKEKYRIQMELAEGYVVMAVITSSDTEDTIARLVSALKDIERTYGKKLVIMFPHVTANQVNELVMSPREAFYAEHEQVAIDDSIGRVSADTLMIYPPGIPLLIPGERISPEVVRQYHYYRQLVGHVLTEAKDKNFISVVKGEM